MTDQIQPKFETWALVELFGHTQLAGKVSEQGIAGAQFVRIDIPETKATPAFTKYHGASAIYGITPVDEEYARAMAEKIEAQPVADYKHHQVIRALVEKKMQALSPVVGDTYYGGEERPIDTGLNEDEFLGRYQDDPDFEDDFDYGEDNPLNGDF